MTYSADVSTPARSVSSETPRQPVSSFDHLVTQWMSTVNSSCGSACNSSHDHDGGSIAAPVMERRQSASSMRGVGPAESTGKSVVRYCPGGIRPAGAAGRRRPKKPRVT